MTKADLVEKVTGLGDLTRRDGEVIVETIFGSVIGALQSGDKIEIRGFGSFRIRQRKPRIGRNPKTGARVDVPAKKVPYFKPSKELRDLVNPGEAKAKELRHFFATVQNFPQKQIEMRRPRYPRSPNARDPRAPILLRYESVLQVEVRV